MCSDYFSKKKRRPFWTKSLLKEITKGLGKDNKELKREIEQFYDHYVTKPKEKLRKRLKPGK